MSHRDARMAFSAVYLAVLDTLSKEQLTLSSVRQLAISYGTHTTCIDDIDAVLGCIDIDKLTKEVTK